MSGLSGRDNDNMSKSTNKINTTNMMSDSTNGNSETASLDTHSYMGFVVILVTISMNSTLNVENAICFVFPKIFTGLAIFRIC